MPAAAHGLNSLRLGRADHPARAAGRGRWSAFWDKRDGVWRVAEDDPDSDLYAASSDASTVIAYIQAHS